MRCVRKCKVGISCRLGWFRPTTKTGPARIRCERLTLRGTDARIAVRFLHSLPLCSLLSARHARFCPFAGSVAELTAAGSIFFLVFFGFQIGTDTILAHGWRRCASRRCRSVGGGWAQPGAHIATSRVRLRDGSDRCCQFGSTRLEWSRFRHAKRNPLIHRL